MADELEKIIAGSFDVVPAIQALALRVLAAERDLGKLMVVEPVEDAGSMRKVSIGSRLPAAPAVLVKGTPEHEAAAKLSATSKQRASGKGGSG